MNEHVDLDALADLLAGEGSTEAEAHLRTCPTCAQALVDLEAAMAPVADALAALPEPELPADLVGRLEAALAQERAARAPALPSSAPVSAPSTTPQAATASATVMPLELARSRRTRWLPTLAGVAAAAALITGGVVLWPSGGTSSDKSTALSARPSLPTSNTGTDYRKDGVQLKAALPGLLAGAPEAAKAAGGVASSARGTTGGAGSVTAPTAPSALMAPAPDPLSALRAPATLAACLAGLTDAADPGLPLALDYAQFEGTPALVVVLPTTKPGKVDVFVVAAQCTQADAHLLFFTRLSRPA